MTAPAGIFGAQVQDLRDLFALSPAFIAECATSVDPDVNNHIGMIADVKDETPRPRVLVCDSRELEVDDFGYASGSTVVIIERDVEPEFARDADSAEGPNPKEAFTRFDNFVGSVVADVITEARNGGHLFLGKTTRLTWPQRSDLEETDKDGARVDYIECKIQFQWGIRK